MQSFHDRISYALDLLTAGLQPFVERALKDRYRDEWLDVALESFRKDRGPSLPSGEVIRWDAYTLLTVMWDQWNSVFRHRLTHADRSLVNELREFRNRWAHQQSFDFDDTYRILDSTQRLLVSVEAPEADEIANNKRDLFREEFNHEFTLALQQSRTRGKQMLSFSLYIVCCIAIVLTLFSSFGFNRHTWSISVAVMLTFAYFSYQLLAVRPALFGPHECIRCGRIIYSLSCPYCEMKPLTVSPTEEPSEPSRIG